MELKIETNHFNTELHREIAENLTLERLVEITARWWDDSISFQKALIESEVFNRLSTKRKEKWLRMKMAGEVEYQRGLRNEDFFTRTWMKELSDERIKKYERQLILLTPPKEGSIGDPEIQRAKMVPISQLIEFKRRHAKCLWHDDRNPSLYYYEKDNIVKCFSCGAKEDSIGVMMKLHNIEFIEAVKKLINV